MADKVLDTQGLNCPLPVLKARAALKTLAAGGTLELTATDPGSVADFKEFCSANGHVLVEATERDGVLRFVIRRGGS